MNWDRIAGNWKQLNGTLQEHWGRFKVDEVQILAGKRMQAAGLQRKRYGISKDMARHALAEFQYRQRDWSTRR
jgi:uncharacterized protein YjbJ (UPF0337 family)